MNFRQRFAATALGVLAGVIASAGTLAVVSAGFALSFDAIRAVGKAAHINAGMAWMLPVTVDGAMAVATVTAVVLHRMDRPVWYPWCVVMTGVLVSVGCNALHAFQEGGAKPLPPEWAMAVSAIPAVNLALSVHLLVTLVEAEAGRAQRIAASVPDRPVGDVHSVDAPQADASQADATVNGETRELLTLIREQARTARERVPFPSAFLSTAELPPARTRELPAGRAPEVPLPAAPEVPPRTPARRTGSSAPARTGSSGRGKSGSFAPARTGSSARRSADDTRKLAERIQAEQPEITRKALAERLGISPRRLRDVLKDDATPASVNGHDFNLTSPEGA